MEAKTKVRRMSSSRSLPPAVGWRCRSKRPFGARSSGCWRTNLESAGWWTASLA